MLYYKNEKKHGYFSVNIMQGRCWQCAKKS